MRISSARLAFVLDSGQRVVRWFPSAQALLGFREGEALGQPCYQLFQCRNWEGDALACCSCRLFITALEGGLGQSHLLLRRRDGLWSPFLASLTLIPPQSQAAVFLQALGWRDLPALEVVTSAVARSPNLDQALDSVLERALALTGAEIGEVFLSEGPGGDMVMAAHRGIFPGAFTQITRFPMGVGFPGLEATTGSPLITTALGSDPRYLRTRVKDKGFQFYLCLPLLGEAGVVGCLNVASRSLPKDMSSIFQVLWPLAHMTSAAVQLNRLRAQERVIPWGAPWVAEAPWSPEPLLLHVLQAMMDVEGAEGGVVSLWAPDLQEFRPKVALGLFRERVCSIRACPALEKGEAIVFSRGQLDSPPCQGGVRGLAWAACLPLLRGRDRLGLISLGSCRRSSLPTRHLALLSAMAARAAQAMGYTDINIQTLEVPGAPARQAQPLPVSLAPSPQAPFLEFRCFGGFQVRREGNLLPLSAFGRRQSISVLKILLTRRGKPVSQEYLMECLWPDAPPEAGRNRLHGVIHSLRRCLEPPGGRGSEAYIQRGSSSYRFNTDLPHRLDVEEFLEGIKRGRHLEAQGERLKALGAYETAALLYGGDYLEDELYSDWCSAEREVLRETYISLLKTIAGLLKVHGDLEGCIRYHRQALAVDEVREEVHRELMRTLYQAGRRDEALSQYLACQEVLARELKVTPLPETEELYRTILGAA